MIVDNGIQYGCSSPFSGESLLLIFLHILFLVDFLRNYSKTPVQRLEAHLSALRLLCKLAVISPQFIVKLGFSCAVFPSVEHKCAFFCLVGGRGQSFNWTEYGRWSEYLFPKKTLYSPFPAALRGLWCLFSRFWSSVVQNKWFLGFSPWVFRIQLYQIWKVDHHSFTCFPVSKIVFLSPLSFSLPV